ncbi:MAG: hybrid sensor histidine kinase/response regulator, partial [Prolixibacteraceae bacterium]|nr:hybrid sensor histidine kinase/response regulator [Prolixibacteraceae bacterium]
MRILFSFIILFFLVGTGAAQTPRFDHFDISIGLSQNNINGLVIDDKGNIWAGTLDGLNKYNGYEFEVFKPLSQEKGGISGNHLISMGKGLNGDIWITTRDGVLNQYQASLQKFRNFDSEIFSDQGIIPENNIVQYNDSLLWFSQNDKAGVLNINDENCQTYDAPGYIHGICIKNDSILIYGEFGISYWKPGSNDLSLIVAKEKISSTPCYFIQRDRDKWISVSKNGIYDNKNNFESSVRLFSFNEVDLAGINLSGLTSFAVSNNNYWLGGNNLLVRINKGKESWESEQFSYDVENDYTFKGYNVTHLKFDELGNLWIGTQKNGINHLNFKKNQFLHYNWNAPSQSRPDADPVRAICNRRNGNLWLGFDRNGVGIISPDGEQKFFSHYFTKSGDVNTINNVRSIFEDSEGNLWIGESDELCVFNEKLKRIEAVNVRFNWQWPHHSYVLKEIEPGILIITSSQQIGLVDIKTMALKETITIVNNENYLPGSLRDIILDPNENYWVAKDEHGLFKAGDWDEIFYVVQKQSHQLSDNKVYCMLANGDSLWISTNSGLNLFSLKEEKVIKRYFERDGLCNNIVYSISRDKSGILWMSTNRGLSRFNPVTENFRTYLPNDFFMDDAHFTDNQGRIFFGGYAGVVAFQPEDIVPLNIETRTTLENFSLFNKQILPGDTVDKRVLLKKPINEIPALKLKHDENSFSISFNAYPFDVPNQNVFRYRLSGLQKEWTISEKTNRQASYIAVPPGSYTFEVQSALSHTQYGPVNKIIIEIVPPFWQTTWFKGVLIFVIIVFVVTGYHLRLQQIRKRNILLKNQVEEQTRELRNRNKRIVEISEQLHESDQSRLRLFTNISHDFRTPLTLILAHLDNLESTKNKTKKTIRNNALRLLSFVNQLIDLRKLDQGELSLSVSQLDIVDFTGEIVESFQILASKQGIDLHFYSQVKTLEVWLDKDKIEKILNNLLSNALKYTPNGKSVLVSIAESEDSFFLIVEDKGI